MKFLRYLILALILLTTCIFAQDNARLTVLNSGKSSYVFVTQHQLHLKYGLAFPLTYKFILPQGISGLIAKEKHSVSDSWQVIPEKHKDDTFNNIEAVRFNYNKNSAYVSAAFNGNDSLFIEICDSAGNEIQASYSGITKYYDNRKAAVTVTADDFASWYYSYEPYLLRLFRSYGLYVTVGVITTGMDSQSWSGLQSELDSGYVEAASHSRTHSHTPYSDPVGEVIGSAEDITSHIWMPGYFNVNRRQYVYTWIAPYGDYDSTVDSLLGTSSYLTARLYTNLDTTSPRIYIYGDSTFSNWDSKSNHFKPFFPTVELGAPSWGGGDTSLTSLNNLFDTIVAKGGIYHLMWHPQVIYPDRNKRYLLDHLKHISGNPDIWYVNLGPLYLYHMMQEENSSNTTVVSNSSKLPASYILYQNYPNPFNPFTTIEYSIPKASFVTIKVYDILGRVVTTLVNEEKSAGNYRVEFPASGSSAYGRVTKNLSSGIYIYQLRANNYIISKKMLLLK